MLCAKGVEQTTLRLPLEVASDVRPGTPAAVLTGPNFAHEIAAGLPAAAVVAASDTGLREAIAALLGTPSFRLYGNDDPIGAQVGGAAKNVIAIAAGAVIGAGLGENARAALITRGLAELARLAMALGGRPETVMGLSGLGDLLLTCTGPTSRNYSLGLALGRGEQLADVLAARSAVTEGVATAPALVARAAGVDLPICAAVAALLAGRTTLGRSDRRPAGTAAAERMIRGVLTVGGWTMASRILGFARDMLIAAILGAGPIADAFFVALKLPNLFRRLFGEGAFNAAFVPAFAGMLAAEGRPMARQFAAETFAVMAFWLGALTIVGEVFMPQMMAVLAPGFAATPAKFALAVGLSRITFPYLLLICLAALASGVLNGLDRFTAASASYVLFNVVSIACMLWLTPYVPTAGHALSWGITVSGVAQLGLLLWALHRGGMGLSLPRPRLTPQIRVLLRRMLPGLIGAGVTQLNLAVDVIIASLLPAGTVSVLYYADRVQQLPLGVIGTAVGTALLPLLSRQVRGGEAEAARTTLNRAIEYALFLTLPAAVALIVSAWPVMSALFGRGAFDAENVRLSSQSLAAYALGLPAFVLVKVLAPAFFARGDTATPVKIGVAAVALNLAMNVAFMVPLQHIGPALATSLAAVFNVGWLGALLARRGHLTLDTQLRQRGVRIAAATLVMGAALWFVQQALFSVPLHGIARIAALAELIVAGIATYGIAALLFGAIEWRVCLRLVRYQNSRRGAKPS